MGNLLQISVTSYGDSKGSVQKLGRELKKQILEDLGQDSIKVNISEYLTRLDVVKVDDLVVITNRMKEFTEEIAGKWTTQPIFVISNNINLKTSE